MAASNITKKALASALKILMQEMPFSKISVRLICEKCNMNRKSFYYHFKDKYDLVNWIFETEYASTKTADKEDSSWDKLEGVCCYFFDNKDFYKQVFKIDGQNSFTEYCRELMMPLLHEKITCIISDDVIPDFYVNLFADLILCSVKRWLLKKTPLPPKIFISLIKNLIESGGAYVYRTTTKDTQE